MSVMITVLVSASASEVAQLPFVISGYVFYENGSPAYNPDVTITLSLIHISEPTRPY